MPNNIQVIPVSFTPGGVVVSRVSLAVGGLFVRCIQASADFEISFDGSPFIPFGVARSISKRNPDGTPVRFQNIELANGTSNDIVLIVGDVDYEDARTALFPNQTVRETLATTLRATNFVTVSAVTPLSLGGGTGAKLVNVRNTHATQSLLVSTSTSDLTGGAGLYVGPGENVDLPVSSALYVIGAVGTTGIFTEARY